MKLYTAVFALLVLVSCKKEESKSGILFTQPDPFIQVTSVDALIPHGSGCGLVPSPADSTASVTLDINNDGLGDFNLSCVSWYDFVSASSPCANYNTRIILSGTSNTNQVSVSGNYDIVTRYDLAQTIDDVQDWSNSAVIMMNSATVPFSADFNGTAYLGVKVETNQGDHFGWIEVYKNFYQVEISSYAINQQAGSPIQAGQIE